MSFAPLRLTYSGRVGRVASKALGLSASKDEHASGFFVTATKAVLQSNSSLVSPFRADNSP